MTRQEERLPYHQRPAAFLIFCWTRATEQSDEQIASELVPLHANSLPTGYFHQE